MATTDLETVGLGLGERVVQDDIDPIRDRLIGIDLGDHQPVGVPIQKPGQSDHDDVVVIDQGDPDRSPRVVGRFRHVATIIVSRGVNITCAGTFY